MARLQNVRALSAAVDLAGRRFVVTGGTDGIGRALCGRLARAGAEVLIGARSPGKAQRVVDELRREADNELITSFPLDLASQASVAEAVETLTTDVDRIDVVVANAGVGLTNTGIGYTVTADGHELTMAINHFGHATLVVGLVPLLRQGEAPRVVFVTSLMHRFARSLPLDDLVMAGRYNANLAYSRSKLANILFSRAFARRHPDISTYSVHPGGVDTSMLRTSVVNSKFKFGYQPMRRLFLLSADEAAAGVERVVVDPELDAVSGSYFELGALKTASRLARNDAVADRLWSLTIDS